MVSGIGTGVVSGDTGVYGTYVGGYWGTSVFGRPLLGQTGCLFNGYLHVCSTVITVSVQR